MSRNNGRAAEAGFTLIEMLVLVAVMGLVLLLIAGYGQPHSRWLQTRTAAAQIAAAMRAARGRAIAGGAPVVFALPALPAWLDVAVDGGDGAPDRRIVFAPDGSSSGGRVVLDDGGRDIAISADFLTGEVRIAEP